MIVFIKNKINEIGKMKYESGSRCGRDQEGRLIIFFQMFIVQSCCFLNKKANDCCH